MAKLAATVEENVEVRAFGGPLQALAYAAENAPDLLITDFKMMPFDADEFIRRFRRIGACADVPAVVVTAYQDVEFRGRAIEAGSTDFLLTPVDHREFVEQSRKLLASRGSKTRAGNARSSAEQVMPLVVDQAVVEAQVEMTTEMLRTVNAHLAAALAALDLVTCDLQNLGEITQTAAVFVDDDLRVRRFTPAFAAICDLRASDVGRTLTEIRTGLVYGGWEVDFRRVGETKESLEKYVGTADGKSHYLMRMVPYRRADGLFEGATITFAKVGALYGGRS
jgi:DNA-binding response OmpR family regulator